MYVTHSPMGVVGPEAPRFVKMPPISLPAPLPEAGSCCFELSLEQNSAYSLSTLDTARKGQLSPGTKTAHAVEGAARGCGTFPTPITTVQFPQDYHTDFSPSKVRFSDFPEFLSDIQGVFRVHPDPFEPAAVFGEKQQAKQVPTREHVY
jgi:hypothetical protein